MTIKDIIKKHLEENGIDGLVGENCGCETADLMPCENPQSTCKPAKKIVCKESECDKCYCDCPGYDERAWRMEAK